MDNCKLIQELILTDYTDGQANSFIKDQVERHLLECPACQAFALEVKETLVKPFERVHPKQVPASVWINIKEEINQQPVVQEESSLERIKAWANSLTLPRIVPVLVSCALILFVSSSILIDQQVKQAKDQEAGADVSFVLASLDNVSETNDFGTPIEKYFL